MDAQKKACNSSHMRFLKKIREDRGLTQYGMAKFLGMIQQTYIHYEEKAQGIKLEVLSALRRKLGMTWEDLGQLIDKEVGENKKKKS
jgi:transcriptional regulator with XRE-family HTH domain